jgi:hypothetical protein
MLVEEKIEMGSTEMGWECPRCKVMINPTEKICPKCNHQKVDESMANNEELLLG